MTATTNMDLTILLPVGSGLQQSDNLLVSPSMQPSTDMLACTPSTSIQFQRKRRRHHTASATKNDELLNAWLSSEIAANSVRAELAKVKTELANQKIKVFKLQEEIMTKELQRLHSCTD